MHAYGLSKSEVSTLTQKFNKGARRCPVADAAIKNTATVYATLAVNGILNVQDQLDSQFRLEAKNIVLDQVCELRLSANTKFETKQGIPIDQIETTLKVTEMTTAGQIRLHMQPQCSLPRPDCAYRPTQIEDIKDSMLWQGTLYYTNETPIEYSLANTTAYVHNAKLILNGSAQQEGASPLIR